MSENVIIPKSETVKLNNDPSVKFDESTEVKLSKKTTVFTLSNSEVNVSPPPGNTYYVARTSSGLNDGSSATNAWDISSIDQSQMLPGDVLYFFEEEEYTISDPLEITQRGIIIRGKSEANTVIKVDTVNKGFGFGIGVFYTEQNDVIFENFTIDGNMEADPAPGEYGPSYNLILNEGSGYSSGIEIINESENCVIQNVTAKNCVRSGFFFAGSGHVGRNLTTFNTMRSGIEIGRGGIGGGGDVGISATNISLYNINLTRSLSRGNIDINDGVNGLLIDGAVLTNNTAGNLTNLECKDHQGEDQYCRNITIKNLTIEDDLPVCKFYSQNGDNDMSNILLEDWTLTKTSNQNGNFSILLETSIFTATLRRITIIGNSIYCYNKLGNVEYRPNNITIEDSSITRLADTANQTGIDIRNSDSVSVLDCTVSGWGVNGILFTDCTDVTTSNNTIIE